MKIKHIEVHEDVHAKFKAQAAKLDMTLKDYMGFVAYKMEADKKKV